MALEYGVNLPASNMKNVLADIQRTQSGIKAWDQYFGAASLDYQKQQSELTKDYSDVINEAYKTNYMQQQDILNSGLSDMQADRQLQISKEELDNMYQTYLSNYSKASNELANSYNENVAAIDKALTSEAENYVSLFNSAYDYLSKELYGSTFKGKDLLTERGLSNYVQNGVLTDWNTIKEGLFDNNGALTLQGVEFYDKLLNMDPEAYTTILGENTRTFDKWLSDTNPELREFYNSADPYNYNLKGTRAGTLNQLLGRDATDETYNENEYRSTTMSAKELGIGSTNVLNKNIQWTKGAFGNKSYSDIFANYKNSYNQYTKSISTATQGNLGSYAKDYTNAFNTFVNDYYREVTNEYNSVIKNIKTSLGESDFESFWNEYGSYVDESYNDITNIKNKEIKTTPKTTNIEKSKATYDKAKQIQNTDFAHNMNLLYKAYENWQAYRTLEKQSSITGDPYNEDKLKLEENLTNIKSQFK